MGELRVRELPTKVRRRKRPPICDYISCISSIKIILDRIAQD
jgi:hypothetical protein